MPLLIPSGLFCVTGGSRGALFRENCAECEFLIAAHCEAVDRLQAASKKIAEAALTLELDYFEKIWSEALRASQECASLRKRFIRHLESHG
jgi:hypothetical protein